MTDVTVKAYEAKRGFTLIELAVVLFIVMLLLGGLLPTVSSQIEQQKRNETRKQLDDIQQALMGYAIINKRLPCPAIPVLSSSAAGAGQEFVTGGNCDPSLINGSKSFGVLPWATLGLKETDAWEHRYTYAVTNVFTATGGFTLANTGTLKIVDATGGTVQANTIPAVVISHGANGLGAYTALGGQILGAAGDELTNSSAATTDFVSHEIRGNFDDLIVWITPGTLFNRMVAAGQLP